ncbi:PilN domain-containing protein [Ferriphaselus sp. R-1]|uniref:PilN domain-containing protein n=1 Tax=Ferriphaselus sp. R-1 TaxID=1485544 RepID=UPI0012681DEB|nr:PilN domain-containing protein [Ferriphaselus sp. R-1]
MPRLHLDYQHSARPFPRLGVAVLALSLLALPLVGMYYSHLSERLSGWEDSLEQLERSSKRLLHQVQRGGDTTLELDQLHEVTRLTAVPWDALFLAVERTVEDDIALLGLDPDPARHEVKIHGEARNYAAMLDFIHRLEQQPEFGGVYLQSHQLELDDPERPMSFALLAQWKGAR